MSFSTFDYNVHFIALKLSFFFSNKDPNFYTEQFTGPSHSLGKPTHYKNAVTVCTSSGGDFLVKKPQAKHCLLIHQNYWHTRGKKSSNQLNCTYAFPAPCYCTTNFEPKNHL